MTTTFGQLYEAWTARTAPTPATARMTRTTLKYLARAIGADDWTAVAVLPDQHAMVLLDAALTGTSLGSQSRSNYRNYLRRFYRFAADSGIRFSEDGADQLWPPAPDGSSIQRRSQVAYQNFVKWAISRGIWPATVRAENVHAWALDQRLAGNDHWRQDYQRLQQAWEAHAGDRRLRALRFPPLPAPINQKFAVSVEDWAAHLQDEWQRLCRDASAPLRNGGQRPWRQITRQRYEAMLTRFIGWFAMEYPGIDMHAETWASLLSPARCQSYLNWLVARSGKNCLNPWHTSFLRAVRGFHRFLLGSPPEVVQQLTELCKRCEVEERDKASRMVPYPVVLRGYGEVLEKATDAMRGRGHRRIDGQQLAQLQVDAIVLGLLTTRALRRANIIGIRIGQNLVCTEEGCDLRFASHEMKGHRRFDTQLPAELVPVVKEYLRSGYRALTGRKLEDGDFLLVTRRGTPLDAATFTSLVARLTKKHMGRRLNPHLFRHIVATHAAQVWRMTPPELAAFLAHRNVTTVMRYYEVTNPIRAAQRIDAFRNGHAGEEN